MDIGIPTAILIGGITGGLISFLTNRYIQQRSFSASRYVEESSHGHEVERMILATIHKLDLEYYHPIIQAARTFASDRALGKPKFSFHWLAVYIARIREFRDAVGAFYLKDQSAECVLIYLSDLIENRIDFLNEEEKNVLAAEAKFAKSHAEFWNKLEKDPLKDLFKKYEAWGEENLSELRKLLDCFWRLFITELRWEFYVPWRGEMIPRLEKDNLEFLEQLLKDMEKEKIIRKEQGEGFLKRLKQITSY